MAALSDFNPEARNRLDAVLNAFAVNKETRDLVWSRVTKASFSPADPMAIVIAIETLFEHRGADIVAALNDLPRLVEAASRHAVGPVADQAVANVEERIAAREEKGSQDFKRLVAAAVSKIETHMAGAAESHENRLALRAASIEKREVIETVAKLGVGAAIVAAILVVLIGWGVGSWAYNMGRAETVQASNALGALASRPDANLILRYAEYNDLNSATAAWCGTGAGDYLTIIQGARKCGPFWYDAPPIAGENPVHLTALWNMVNGPLQQFPPLALLAAGAALVAAAWFWRSRKA